MNGQKKKERKSSKDAAGPVQKKRKKSDPQLSASKENRVKETINLVLRDATPVLYMLFVKIYYFDFCSLSGKSWRAIWPRRRRAPGKICCSNRWSL